MSIAGCALALRWPELITEPPEEDKIFAARAGAAQDGFRLCTEDLEPAPYVLSARQASRLDAMETVVQQERQHKPANVSCHRQQHRAPVVGAEAEGVADAGPHRHQAPAARRHAVVARDEHHVGIVDDAPCERLGIQVLVRRHELNAIALTQMFGDVADTFCRTERNADGHDCSAIE
jgi:hypothetical protein